MMPEITINEIIRSKRRTIALEVTRDGRLVVRAPLRTSLRFIHNFVNEKSAWIYEKQEWIRTKCSTVAKKQFVTGEEFLFLGNSHLLEVVANSPIPFCFESGFKLSIYHHCNARKLFITWYQQQALSIFAERVNYYATQFGFTYQKIKLSNAQKRWGSCSHNGNLNFSWRLIMAPLAVIDYVVVHELAHLKEMNHSKKFWHIVKSIIPDFKIQQHWLKEQSYQLVF